MLLDGGLQFKERRVSNRTKKKRERERERTMVLKIGKEADYRFSGSTDGRTGDVINNLINNYKNK